jgi:hypothetical protein
VFGEIHRLNPSSSRINLKRFLDVKSGEVRLMKLRIIISEQRALKHVSMENSAAGLVSLRYRI